MEKQKFINMTREQAKEIIERLGGNYDDVCRDLTVCYILCDIADSYAVSLESLLGKKGTGPLRFHINKMRQHSRALIRTVDSGLANDDDRVS